MQVDRWLLALEAKNLLPKTESGVGGILNFITFCMITEIDLCWRRAYSASRKLCSRLV